MFIGLSGYVDDSQIKKAKLSGMHSIVLKPLSNDYLKELIKKLWYSIKKNKNCVNYFFKIIFLSII